MPFKVGKFAGVGAKMRTLADRASLGGIRQAYLDALEQMLSRLENAPLQWGDPVYRLPHQGGVVFHATVSPIRVQYSVHEPENSVLIIDINPLFDWPIRP